MTGRRLHTCGVERPVFPRHPPGEKSRPHFAIENHVAVTPACRREARVEFVIDSMGPLHADALGEIGVGAVDPGARAAYGVSLEVNDLRRRMHAGVGAAGAYHPHRPVRHLGERLFDAALHRAHPALLRLPAGKITAVVFDAEGDTHGMEPFQEKVRKFTADAMAGASAGTNEDTKTG